LALSVINESISLPDTLPQRRSAWLTNCKNIVNPQSEKLGKGCKAKMQFHSADQYPLMNSVG